MTTKIPVELSSTPGIVDGSNATAITIDSSENVGIGQTSPSSPNSATDFLHIGSSSSTYSSLILEDNNNTWEIFQNNQLSIRDGTATRLLIDTSGNVGIGTTSPSRVLHTQGSSVLFGNTSGAHEILFGDSAHRYFKLYTPSSPDYASIRTGTTDILVAHSNGNVGIGTSNPGGPLQVQMTHTSTDVTAANSNETLILGNAGSGDGVYNAIKFGGNQQDMYIMSFNDNTQADRRLGFFLGSVAGDAVADERLSIRGNGNVGVGIVAPNANLEVFDASGGAGTGVRINCNNGGSDVWDLYSTTAGRLYVKNPNYSGGVYIQHSATSWTSNSDENLKENITSLGTVGDKLKNYRTSYFTWKDDNRETPKRQIGFIAQDWETDFPEVVNKMEGEPLGMQYTETIPILLKYIQELEARITTLEG